VKDEQAATLRILSQYKRLVLLGNARLPFAEARRLVGPDCAYHLYFRHASLAAGPARARRRRLGRRSVKRP
jgi:hypothetical protein